MRVGDKVICKKDYTFEKYQLRKGCEYIISEIDIDEYDYGWVRVGNNSIGYKFDIYFYSKKELRKLKLEAIESR